MKAKKKNCLLQADRPSGEIVRADGWPIDTHTTQAFQNFRAHAEDLALELAARLRVLGKSLAMGCPERVEFTGDKTTGYQSLRLQLDRFIGSLVEHGFAELPYFSVVRDYFQEFLPVELNGCVGQACRVEQVETVISLLSESANEQAFAEGLMVSYSS